MPLYEANGDKQKPIARTGTKFYSHATCPASFTTVKRPSYVTVNKIGTFKFMYESGSEVTSYITGSVVQSSNIGGFRLDISPIAWERTDDDSAIGDVTFVYVRVG